jgi:hypothetical protein
MELSLVHASQGPPPSSNPAEFAAVLHTPSLRSPLVTAGNGGLTVPEVTNTRLARTHCVPSQKARARLAHALVGPHEVVHAVPAPVHRYGKHAPDGLCALTAPGEPAGSSASAGHVSALPLQDSGASHGAADARQTVVAGSLVSMGHCGSRPVHTSALSQTPADARHVKVSGRNASAGHCAVVPVQASWTSQLP